MFNSPTNGTTKTLIVNWGAYIQNTETRDLTKTQNFAMSYTSTTYAVSFTPVTTVNSVGNICIKSRLQAQFIARVYGHGSSDKQIVGFCFVAVGF